MCVELAEPPHEQRGRDVVGQVGDQADPAGREVGERQRQRVGRDDPQPAPGAGGELVERREEARVALDRDHLRGAGIEQRAGQPARARPDLDHAAPGELARRRSDPAQQVRIEQEVLAEPLVGAQLETVEDAA